MSIEAGHLHRSSSPASSGRSSPINSRTRIGREDGPNRKDKNYRRYALGVEKSLSLFDTTLQEWADYISFLGRLLKALQARPQGVAEIPHKKVVAKRLAQCLDPDLPSGVHQKTLEVYGYVFSVLKKDGLGRDLSLYLPGLSPIFSFASLSVKPALLSIFETFILTLNPNALRSAMKAIILALLPGLEEETSEEFERTYSLLNEFKNASKRGLMQDSGATGTSREQYFWQCLFLASITSSSRRQGALSYLTRTLPKLGEYKNFFDTPTQHIGKEIKQLPLEIEAVASPEPGLLIRCFAAGLCDEQLLIQRGFLDLLVTHLPLHSVVLQARVTSEDLERLIAAAVSVVARREMSLNRRLWAWFLGPEPSGQASSNAVHLANADDTISSKPGVRSQSEYFKRFALAALVSSIEKMLASDSVASSSKARPFRICLSLMDRGEIGGLVVPRIFLQALENVWKYQKVASSKESFMEVLRSASVFFDGVDSELIWGEIFKVLRYALQVDESDLHRAQERLDLVLFIVTKFNLQEEEMLLIHLPIAAIVLLLSIQNFEHQSSDQSKKWYGKILRTSLIICNHLIDLVPQRAFLGTPSERSIEIKPYAADDRTQYLDLMNNIETFYGKHNKHVGPPENIGAYLMKATIELIMQDLSAIERAVDLEMKLAIFDKLVRKVPGFVNLQWKDILMALTSASQVLLDAQDANSFQRIPMITSALETMKIALPTRVWQSDFRVRHIIPELIFGLWPRLSPSKPEVNVEAARCIMRLHEISPENQLVESSITTLLIQGKKGNGKGELDVEAGRRFATLWAHYMSGSQGKRPGFMQLSLNKEEKSDHLEHEAFWLGRPLLLLLDSLVDPKTEIFIFTSSWIGSLPDLQTIIGYILFRLRELPYLKTISAANLNSRDETEEPESVTHDVDECLYYLSLILNLAQISKNSIWSGLRNPADLETGEQSDPKVSAKETTGTLEPNPSAQGYLTQICLDILRKPKHEEEAFSRQKTSLRLAASALLEQTLLEYSSRFASEGGLLTQLLETLSWSVKHSEVLLQVHLMSLVLLALKMRTPHKEGSPLITHRRTLSRDTARSGSQQSLFAEKAEKEEDAAELTSPPPALLDCLMLGLNSSSTHPVLEYWVQFLDDCLPFYTNNTFQILMPLVDCFIKAIETVFEVLQMGFEDTKDCPAGSIEPASTIITLCNGLEQVLAKAHDQLIRADSGVPSTKTPEQIQGFFGNMVSGVFALETNRSKSTMANNRLTVLLCFKDTVRVCLKIWSWGDHRFESTLRNFTVSASFNHTSLRLKNRTRRILEHIFAAEALECLETLIESWYQFDVTSPLPQSATILNLLNALDGSRPRNTIPAIFNALYSRTNPNALDPVRKSTLTSNLSDVNLAGFLIAYTRSLDDDAMDEIWTDCMTFLRDVLANPLPHRQTLPKLVEFTALLGVKVDNTNFGEQRRMRRDLGDLFVRILAATFTTKPLGFPNEASPAISDEKSSSDSLQSPDLRKIVISDDIVAILASILPNISKILVETDRITAVITTISTQVLIPTFRWKSYPQNITRSTLDILYAMSRIAEASKTWRKDVAEAFNDPRFFCISSLHLADTGWLPVLRQWVLLDKDRMPDFLARLSPPTSAGIVFGVGASSARLEADRKTQLILRRIAVLVLAASDNFFVANLSTIQEKLVELMTATAASSPSSATRAEIFMLLRALILKISPSHMNSFWPIINCELHDALSSLFPDENRDTYNTYCVVQACKLLEILLIMAPDDFQMSEWLFVTDTIDAVYRPAKWDPVALVDELAEDLDSKAGASQSATVPLSSATPTGERKPVLTSITLQGVPKEDLVDRVLRPFFRQLSISAFESTYSMEHPDWRACYDDLLVDTFDDSTIV